MSPTFSVFIIYSFGDAHSPSALLNTKIYSRYKRNLKQFFFLLNYFQQVRTHGFSILEKIVMWKCFDPTLEKKSLFLHKLFVKINEVNSNSSSFIVQVCVYFVHFIQFFSRVDFSVFHSPLHIYIFFSTIYVNV